MFNPLRLVDRAMAHVINGAIGLTEDEKDALVTPAAIAEMWAEAGYGQAPDTALDATDERS